MGWKQIPTGPFNLAGDSDPTLGGDLDTNGHAILLSESLNNGEYSGVVISGAVAAGVGVGDLVSLVGSSFEKSDIASLATSGNLPAYGMCVEVTGNTGNYVGKILVQGLFRDNSLSLPSIGSVLYAGSPAGTISDTPPSSNQSQSGVQVIGFSWDDTENIIYIKPSPSVLRII